METWAFWQVRSSTSKGSVEMPSACFEGKRNSFMLTLRRYTSADQEAVEQLHVFVIQQTGAYLGRGPWDDDVYAIEEVYLKNQGEFLIGNAMAWWWRWAL
jgi:hypothetical protein